MTKLKMLIKFKNFLKLAIPSLIAILSFIGGKYQFNKAIEILILSLVIALLTSYPILNNLRFFTESFSSADSFNIQIEIKKNNKKHVYVYNTTLGKLTETVFQKLGQYMDDKKCKVLSVAVQPIFKSCLLKQF